MVKEQTAGIIRKNSLSQWDLRQTGPPYCLGSAQSPQVLQKTMCIHYASTSARDDVPFTRWQDKTCGQPTPHSLPNSTTADKSWRKWAHASPKLNWLCSSVHLSCIFSTDSDLILVSHYLNRFQPQQSLYHVNRFFFFFASSNFCNISIKQNKTGIIHCTSSQWIPISNKLASFQQILTSSRFCNISTGASGKK